MLTWYYVCFQEYVSWSPYICVQIEGYMHVSESDVNKNLFLQAVYLFLVFFAELFYLGPEVVDF